MKIYLFLISIKLIYLILSANMYAQVFDDEFDKCGYSSDLAQSYLDVLGDHWGYSYDSLLVDLSDWSANPNITIDSLGASVQNRAIWQLTITNHDTSNFGKQTVFIHARTHPGEVQSWWVTEQIINQLISESPTAQLLRNHCIFYIIPMYNPDGVELEYPRENANGVDIESNWDANPVEPEVAVLRNRFLELMASSAPIQVAMNMHSAYGQHRFFVYHDSVGTSPQFTLLEQEYIEGVRYYYLNGIEPWYYRITWTSGTPPYYPESWFWINFQEAVMALTYEDWNDPLAFNFDSTANAILNGIADYLDIRTNIIHKNEVIAKNFTLKQNYPNPFNPVTFIEYILNKSTNINLSVYDINGQKVKNLFSGKQTAGKYSIPFDATDLASGVYIYQLQTESDVAYNKMLLVK